MKTKVVLKSLSDLSANTLAFAASVPVRGAGLAKQVLAPPIRATRREIRAARRNSLALMQALVAKAQNRWHKIRPWSRGGLNE